MQGFMVVENGKPVAMELCDDIAAGTHMVSPFPVFVDEADAKVAFFNYAGMFTRPAKALIVPVTITFGSSVGEVEYSDREDDEDE
jgi:hypothetical protein